METGPVPVTHRHFLDLCRRYCTLLHQRKTNRRKRKYKRKRRKTPQGKTSQKSKEKERGKPRRHKTSMPRGRRDAIDEAYGNNSTAYNRNRAVGRNWHIGQGLEATCRIQLGQMGSKLVGRIDERLSSMRAQQRLRINVVGSHAMENPTSKIQNHVTTRDKCWSCDKG